MEQFRLTDYVPIFLTFRTLKSWGTHQFNPVATMATGAFHWLCKREPQRAEYAIDSHGWLAIDKFTYITQLIQWINPNGHKFTPPMYWDIQQNDFDDNPFGDLNVKNNTVIIIPILFQAHWGAIEVRRQNDRISLKLFQIPSSIQQKLVRILARRLDVWTRYDAKFMIYEPYMCGWNLVLKWINEAQIQQQLLDITTSCCPASGDSIDNPNGDQCINGKLAGCPREAGNCSPYSNASNLFLLCFLLCNSQCHFAWQSCLRAPATPRFPKALHTPNWATNIDQAFSCFHASLHWGKDQQAVRTPFSAQNWMVLVLDEMDFLYGPIRAMNPETLITALAFWCPIRNILMFPEQFPPELRLFNHIIWPIAFEHRCIQIKIYRWASLQHANLIFIATTAMHPRFLYHPCIYGTGGSSKHVWICRGQGYLRPRVGPGSRACNAGCTSFQAGRIARNRPRKLQMPPTSA